jgi:Leucine-rich repeat (LRR) protein
MFQTDAVRTACTRPFSATAWPLVIKRQRQYVTGLANLELLDLRRNQITDKGLRHVQNLPKLRALYFYGALRTGTGITDEGTKIIGSMSNLEQLDLYNTLISDAGLEVHRKTQELANAVLGMSSHGQ